MIVSGLEYRLGARRSGCRRRDNTPKSNRALIATAAGLVTELIGGDVPVYRPINDAAANQSFEDNGAINLARHGDRDLDTMPKETVEGDLKIATKRSRGDAKTNRGINALALAAASNCGAAVMVVVKGLTRCAEDRAATLAPVRT